MGAIRRTAGLVGAAAAVAVLAGCSTPPAPAAAPGPSAAAQPGGGPGAARPESPAGGPALAAPPAPPAPSAPSAPASAGACPEGGVRVLESGGDSAMGLRIASVQLVNCGTAPYELDGYPQIRLLDRKRAPVEAEVGHGSAGVASGVPSMDAPAERVTLQPGQAASFGMLWRNLVTRSDVAAVEGWAVEVTPKPGAPRVTAELTAPVDLGNTGRLGISPWSAVAR
ncbi:DUF4232 domain-containing protein [Streptomyces sp. NPDC046866]|uniref:DUF4232 domain-containing protein n=1 Tax=Streptomyces sp. NPDC046866 TaxID=3154921 RepID=UPI0034568215